MRAYVVFDTRYGNTARIAKSLEAGLRAAGFETTCVDTRDADARSLEQCELICVGGPTHNRTASETMQSFLQSLKGLNLSGKLAFAFDTRRDSRFAGSAAAFIEERLQRLGLKLVKPRLSAVIISPEPEKEKDEFESKDEWKEWRHRNERLREGEEKRFEQAGREIGAAAKG